MEKWQKFYNKIRPLSSLNFSPQVPEGIIATTGFQCLKDWDKLYYWYNEWGQVIYAGKKEKALSEREEIKQKTIKMRRLNNLYIHEVEMVCS